MSKELALYTQADESGQYVSFSPETPELKAKLFNAINNPESLSEFKNKTINLANVVLEETFANVKDDAGNETDEYREVTRIILMDDKGKGYATISAVVANCVKRLFMVFGEPSSWANPIKIEIKEVKVAKGNAISFDVLP